MKAQADVVAGTEKAAAEGMRRAKQQLQRLKDDTMNGRREVRKAISNEGELVVRRALTPWESLVQALMFCNEASYLN